MTILNKTLDSMLGAFTVAICLLALACGEESPGPQAPREDAAQASTRDGLAVRDIYIPTTISQRAQEALRDFVAEGFYRKAFPAADDLEGWRREQAAWEEQTLASSREVLEANGVTATRTEMGGVIVSDLRPEGWQDNGKVLVYAHGGAFVLNTDETTYASSAPMARATGLRTISIGYDLAPFAKWHQIQSQAVAVIEALLQEGYSPEDIALLGDSAGGNLMTFTVLALRDRGLGMPAAVVLWSPWADLTNAGDTAHTLETADPFLTYDTLLRSSALAFADGLDLADPRISPVYADLSRGFPPTLIQEGTKGIFLSTSVRMYQALVAAGQSAELDVYEGMWHVFQVFDVPESHIAIARSAAFINQHLEPKSEPARSVAGTRFHR